MTTTVTYETWDGTPVAVTEYVHKVGTRWVVARCVGHQFNAPMTKEGMKLTGCQAIFGPSLESVARSPNAHTYTTRSNAIRAAVEIYGWVHRGG